MLTDTYMHAHIKSVSEAEKRGVGHGVRHVLRIQHALAQHSMAQHTHTLTHKHTYTDT
jgi:hypothetical protein